MVAFPKARAAKHYRPKGRPLTFSFFPVTRGNRRWGLYDAVFAVNPWTVIRGTISADVPAVQQVECLAFVSQAEDFYRAATAGVSANPLLLYYSFMNLAKALVRVRGFQGSLDQAMHGMKEETTVGGTEMTDSKVMAKDSATTMNVFPEFIERLGYPRPHNNDTYPVMELLGQVVVGHRIWRECALGNHERFIDLKHIDFMYDKGNKEIWLRLYVAKGDLARYGVSQTGVLTKGGLAALFHVVSHAEPDRKDLVCFEQLQPLKYTGRASDVVADLIDVVRPNLWRIVSAVPGTAYRRYYIHLSDPTQLRLPQMASLWALFFYFGSVVRYRPHLFDKLLEDSYGAFVEEFISSMPQQMLYLMASELCQREIARPAIV
jgi:hypothetical protein